MPITRRGLLAAPAALSAALLPGSLMAALEATTPPMPDLSTWDGVRAQFALDPEWMHFASFFIASHPAVEHHTYPADHGFNCNLRGSYHEPSAALAKTRTLAFLRKHLG